MATRRYKTSPGDELKNVIEEAGAATNSNIVELTVDCAALVNDGGSTRKVSREEVLDALQRLADYIVSHNWPPV